MLTPPATNTIAQDIASELACAALNRLIVACKHDMIAHSAAADVADDSASRERLVEQARLRAIFVRDIRSGIASLGQTPDQIVGMRFFLENVRAKISGKTIKAAYALCARVVTTTEAAYSEALRLEMPDDARFGIERQLVEIQADRRELELRIATR